LVGFSPEGNIKSHSDLDMPRMSPQKSIVRNTWKSTNYLILFLVGINIGYYTLASLNLPESRPLTDSRSPILTDQQQAISPPKTMLITHSKKQPTPQAMHKTV